MKQPSEVLKEVTYWLAFAYLLFNGIFFLLLGSGLLSGNLIGLDLREGAYNYVYLAWGVFSLVVMSYIVRRLLRHYKAQTRISSPGPQGTIWISPFALKDYVLKSLDEKLNLKDAKVTLDMDHEGVGIQIRTAIPLSKKITEMGKEIQDMIKRDVESHIGVHVQKVEIFAASISASETEFEESEEYTPIEFPERDPE